MILNALYWYVLVGIFSIKWFTRVAWYVCHMPECAPKSCRNNWIIIRITRLVSSERCVTQTAGMFVHHLNLCIETHRWRWRYYRHTFLVTAENPAAEHHLSRRQPHRSTRAPPSRSQCEYNYRTLNKPSASRYPSRR